MAVVTALLMLYLRMQHREMAVLLGICGALLLCATGIQRAGEIVQALRTIANETGVYEMVSYLLRGLGIALLGQLCAEVCRATGDGFIASQIEWCTRVELLLLCLSPTMELLTWIREVLT